MTRRIKDVPAVQGARKRRSKKSRIGSRGFAAVASAKGDADRAATLWGATDELFERRRLVLREENRQARKRFRAELDSVLERDEYRRGRAMTLQYAVGCALDEEQPARRPA